MPSVEERGQRVSKPRNWNHPRLFATVALGGAIGSLLRYAVSLSFTISYLGTITVNVIGCLVLGFLIAVLGKRETETLRSQQLRLLLGTGICGGFTTYSTFALDTFRLTFGDENIRSSGQLTLFYSNDLFLATLYVIATLVLGTLAALLGVYLGSHIFNSQKDI